MKKLIGPAIIAVAIVIGGGSMMLASAGDPEPTDPQPVAVLLHCDPDCKVLEGNKVQSLEDEIEALKAEIDRRDAQVDALYENRFTFISKFQSVIECLPEYQERCWQGLIVKEFFPEAEEE